jgi:hypothetical protein
MLHLLVYAQLLQVFFCSFLHASVTPLKILLLTS